VKSRGAKRCFAVMRFARMAIAALCICTVFFRRKIERAQSSPRDAKLSAQTKKCRLMGGNSKIIGVTFNCSGKRSKGRGAGHSLGLSADDAKAPSRRKRLQSSQTRFRLHEQCLQFHNRLLCIICERFNRLLGFDEEQVRQPGDSFGFALTGEGIGGDLAVADAKSRKNFSLTLCPCLDCCCLAAVISHSSLVRQTNAGHVCACFSTTLVFQCFGSLFATRGCIYLSLIHI
jgi:hypothetical protein